MRFIPLFLYLIIGCQNAQSTLPETAVKVGAQVLIENYLPELEGKRLGLVMNQTARVGSVHVLDTLLALNQNITALYAPEHGFRGQFGAGEVIKGGIDQQTGLPVYSLYGRTKKPTPEMLENVDVLLFDMQDVGARFYTYNSTMRLVIEAAAELGIEVWILDRPNPAGGNYVAGWILEKKFESFVGMYPIPVAHGLTLGELALMANGEGWFETNGTPKIRVVEMQGWSRAMKWPDTGLLWYPPSPNLPTFTHAFVYLGTGFIEGTTISEGRGTDDPFLTIGLEGFVADSVRLKQLELSYHLTLDTLTFIPKSIAGKVLHPKYENQKISGIFISPGESFNQPVEFGIELTRTIVEQSSHAKILPYLNLLAGVENFSTSSLNWGQNFDNFLEARKKYLLYD
jgi:uncharacterized protein YbbC (DUF1343 family)